MGVDTTYKPFTPYGMGVSNGAKSKYGVDPMMRDFYAEGIENTHSPTSIGVPSVLQGELSRQMSGFGRLSFLDALTKLGVLNTQMGVRPEDAFGYMKGNAFGNVKGAATNALNLKMAYLDATKQGLANAASLQPKQKTTGKGPNENLVAAGDMGMSAGRMMIGGA